ncbi:hypothetical protein [Corynebacterium minutissimum]|uniref:Hypothetical membrane protein n=1 Tax=Corynebacterium minutissimum TaxID=38301 RepID=A0A2X4US24_9CORY|nr:hypothetical protein [Corynebacterium minutissimum]KHO30279.1 hypothetical protein NX84_02735 [Corynebacterium minutissimum]QPS60256.1 hypothetical protein I6G51_03370 [Corynebacterium minutissimum]QQA78954.1 hypothetical protein I6H49_09480 [Corynebacterium minutissimum]SQI00904.1 hypothetical membrane protein [Corynebacterium minutissimum]VEG05028.1 hypothetical membrane protein [Corynebacterium minutissimum]
MTLSPNTAPSDKPQDEAAKNPKRTEAVSLMLKVWTVALILEAVHLVLSITLTLLNRDELFAQARSTAESAAERSGQEMTDSFVQIVGYGSLVLSSLISLAIVVLLGVMLWMINSNSKAAGTGRRLWFAFSLYFGFRVLIVFLSSPAGANVPDWLFVVDGAVQILVGVAAIMGLIFSSKEEVLEYTGEMEQMRQMRKEMEEQRRLDNQAQRDKDKNKDNDKNTDKKNSKDDRS